MKQIKDYAPMIISFVVILILVFVTPVMAQEEGSHSKNVPASSPIQKWPAFYDCGPAPIVLSAITSRGETPVVESVGIIQIPPETVGGQHRLIQAPIVQYFNSKTLTYSIVANFENGYSCILLFGHGLKPSTQKLKIKPEDLKKKLDDYPQEIDPDKIKTLTHETDMAENLT